MDKYDSSFQLPVRAPAGGGGGGGGGRTNLASSCAVAAAFLLLASAAGAATLFFLFRPRAPAVRVTAVQLPGFSLLRGNGSSVLVSAFSFSEHAAVRNPNRAAFSHYDSRIRLLHAGSQVGFMYIPAGEIGGGRTQFMAATFSVASFPVSPPGGGPTLEVEARMELRGRVRVLEVFVHRVAVVESCRIAVRAADGSVIGVRC